MEENKKLTPEEIADAQKKEAELLFEKKYKCPCCYNEFKAKTLKSGKVRRKEAGRDLRPRAYGVDILKYQMLECPKCGYAAMPQYFDHISSTQRKLIKEQISKKFKFEQSNESIITYEMAVNMYLQALRVCEAKMAKRSEKAYYNLIIHWMIDEQIDKTYDEALKAKLAQRSEKFYKDAYEGFEKAISEEYFPICGMDEVTLDYLISSMAFHFGDYDVASKLLSSVLANLMAPRRIKDMALDLKDEIVAKLKK